MLDLLPPKSERIYNSTVKKFNAFQDRAQPCGGFLLPTGNSYVNPQSSCSHLLYISAVAFLDL